MAADPLRQARPPDRGRDRALYDGFVEMIARRGAEPRISTDPNRWKHKLPSPVGCGLRIMSSPLGLRSMSGDRSFSIRMPRASALERRGISLRNPKFSRISCTFGEKPSRYASKSALSCC